MLKNLEKTNQKMSERDCWKSVFENEALLLRPPDLMLINVRKGSVRSYRKLGGNEKKVTMDKPLNIEWNETLRNECGHGVSSSGTAGKRNIKGYFIAKGHVFASRLFGPVMGGQRPLSDHAFVNHNDLSIELTSLFLRVND